MYSKESVRLADKNVLKKQKKTFSSENQTFFFSLTRQVYLSRRDFDRWTDRGRQSKLTCHSRTSAGRFSDTCKTKINRSSFSVSQNRTQATPKSHLNFKV